MSESEKAPKVVESKKLGESCCGGAPKNSSDACCVTDEKAKDEGKSGCGCNC